MKLKYIAFILIFLTIYLLLNYYVGRTILHTTDRFISISHKWFWITSILLAFSYMIGVFLKGYGPKRLSYFFELIGSYWMAFFMYALLLFPIIQLINLLIKKILSNDVLFNNILMMESVFIIIFFAYVAIWGSVNASHSYVNTFNISNTKLTDGKSLNIVMVSDIHLGNIFGNTKLSKMVDEINNLNPDLILFAGDIVDSNLTPFVTNNMATIFSNLKSKYGTYAALGNHDLMVKDVDSLVNLLESNNVTVLRNQAILVDNSFYIIGRDDVSATRFGLARKNLQEILEPLDTSKLQIVIDHTPSALSESAKNKIDLHFSGHTHKGQVIPGNYITKKIFEINHGHLEKDASNIFVSSGYGTWGPPIRLGSKSEIVNVKVNIK